MMSVYYDNLNLFAGEHSDEDIAKAFDKSVFKRVINQGAVSGLQNIGFGPDNFKAIAASKEPWNMARLGFVGKDFKLNDLGVQLLRSINSKFELVELI
ncbi:hypothetical protein D3C80_1810620 [compost metagenome]